MTDRSSRPQHASAVSPTTGAAEPGLGPIAGRVSGRMRALLSRAVDEHAAEQPAVDDVLAELRAQVAGLAGAVSRTASAAGLEQLAVDLGTLRGDVRDASAALTGQVEALGRTVEQLARAVVAMQGELAGLHDRLQPRAAVCSPEVVASAVPEGVLDELTAVVRGVCAELEQRLAARVDEALRTSAEAVGAPDSGQPARSGGLVEAPRRRSAVDALDFPEVEPAEISRDG